MLLSGLWDLGCFFALLFCVSVLGGTCFYFASVIFGLGSVAVDVDDCFAVAVVIVVVDVTDVVVVGSSVWSISLVDSCPI